MPTFGPLPITPPPGFFPRALTVFSPRTASRFQPLLFHFHTGYWSNAHKRLGNGHVACIPAYIGKPLHHWRTPILYNTSAIIDSCLDSAYYLPDADAPSGTNREFTIGTGTPLTLQALYALLSAFYAQSQAYAIRYGLLWTTIPPSSITHHHQLIHFDGWLT